MKINWKVRFKNPVFWVQIAVAIVVPALTYFGMTWDDMTTWAALGKLLLEIIKNPVVVVSVVISVVNAITDPTTKGISDSTRALGYDKPAE